MNLIQKHFKTLSAKHLIIWLVVIIIPFIIYVQDIIAGEIPFWYDNARDFLSAQANLTDITLIGPTSGIPGVFYGPYWIWLISGGIFVNPDPRFTAILLGAISYLIIFPIVLFKFSKLFGFVSTLLVWLLFVISFGGKYATNLWNPHMAPVLFLIFVAVLTFTNIDKLHVKRILTVLAAGVLAGLITNFHISFGIGILMGSIIWFLVYPFIVKRFEKQKLKFSSYVKDRIIIIVSFLAGFFFMFLPFFAFEIRHGFNQIKVTIETLTAVGSVVAVTGLNDGQIVSEFFKRGADLLQLPLGIFSFVLLASIVIVGFLTYKKKIEWSELDIKLLSLLIILSIGILVVDLTSKNPVWGYHFIGVEVIFMLLFGLMLSKVKFLQIAAVVWIIVLIFIFFKTAYVSFTNDPLLNPSLVTKEFAVNKIYKDSNGMPFEVFAYSPSIYIYDYAYLFDVEGDKQVSYKPEDVPQNAELYYVILPYVTGQSSFISVTDKTLLDFVNYRTPEEFYVTTKTIGIPDGSVVLRRERRN